MQPLEDQGTSSLTDNQKNIEKSTSKIFHVMECLFENLVDEEPAPKEGDTKRSRNIFLYVFCIPSYLLLICLAGMTALRFQDSDQSVLLDVISKIIVLASFLASMWILQRLPEVYEHKHHFSDVPATGKYMGIVCIFAYFAAMIVSSCTKWDLFIIAALPASLFFTLFLAFIQAQKCTQLRFDPTADNKKFTKKSMRGNSKGYIVSSSAFEIVLQNRGSEVFNSTGFKILRKTSNDNFVEIYLPEFSLESGEQITLVPESFTYEGPCIRVPGFNCFGKKDLSHRVETYLLKGKRSKEYRGNPGKYEKSIRKNSIVALYEFYS